MKRLCLVLILLLLPRVASGQAPHIGYVYPAGGKVGTSFEVAVGGQRLAGLRGVHVSGEGVEARVIEHLIPLTGVQAQFLRDELKQLVDHKTTATTRPAATQPWTDALDKRIAEIRNKLALFQPQRLTPAIAEIARLELKVAANAEPGWREIRLLTANGLTNPMVFEIGRLEEFTKERITPVTSKSREMRVTLPGVVNGQVAPGAPDRFRFAARKGDHLVAIVSARKLVPYLADAVPGWFQAVVTLYDSSGREVAYADDFRHRPDPILHCLIPADGEFVLEIKDSIHRGREDFVYRIALGELPLVTGIFPLGGAAGARTVVELQGWNLPTYRVVMDASALEPGVHPLRVMKRSGMCNGPPFAIDTLPEFTERESPAAQIVTLPIILNGRIDRPGDVDVFSFEARAGENIVAEVTSRRLDSPLDSVLKLSDSTGKQLAFNDDHEDKSDGLNTHHADSYITATLASPGRYSIQIADVQGAGGPEYAYRLRLSRPRPGFALRVVPSSINIRPGQAAAVTVVAQRQDGFAGDIEIALEDAPPGVKLSKGRIARGEDQVKLALTSTSRQPEPVALHVIGTATIDGDKLTRDAVAADDMMQAFIYRHLVCANELLMTVTQRRAGTSQRATSLK
jgi:hypothetical protein